MGCGADDEVYKDLLQLHVHAGTRLGVDLGGADRGEPPGGTQGPDLGRPHLAVDPLVAISYDWGEGVGSWNLSYVEGG